MDTLVYSLLIPFLTPTQTTVVTANYLVNGLVMLMNGGVATLNVVINYGTAILVMVVQATLAMFTVPFAYLPTA
jgi:hypothetical protein